MSNQNQTQTEVIYTDRIKLEETFVRAQLAIVNNDIEDTEEKIEKGSKMLNVADVLNEKKHLCELKLKAYDIGKYLENLIKKQEESSKSKKEESKGESNE